MVDELKIKASEDLSVAIVQDVLGPILNREVSVTVGSIGEADSAKLAANFQGSVVVVDAPLEGALSGVFRYVFTQRLAAAITDLMVMGDGSAPFNEQESLDGVSEATNQIVGALCTFYSDKLGSDARQSGAKAEMIDIDKGELDLTGFTQVDYKLSIEGWGDDVFTKLVPDDLNESISQIAGEDIDMPDMAAEAAPPISPGDAGATTLQQAEFSQFDTPQPVRTTEGPRNLDLLLDISLPVTIELGRTNMVIREILEIGPGSVIELQKLSGEPVDLYVNDRKFALGEVVVIDENFGIRITELLSVEDRIKSLR